jgi:hypothetical protein
MAATFPGGIASFTTKNDTTDVIYAAHINSLQNEVLAIETVLGAAAVRTSTWSGGSSFSQTTNWTTLADRLNNIESGLLSYGALAAPTPLMLAGM